MMVLNKIFYKMNGELAYLTPSSKVADDVYFEVWDETYILSLNIQVLDVKSEIQDEIINVG